MNRTGAPRAAPPPRQRLRSAGTATAAGRRRGRRWRICRLQIEHDEPLVLQPAAKLRPQVAVKSRIMPEPPERRPCEGDEPCPRSTESLDFLDRRDVIERRPPVPPVPFEERDRPPQRELPSHGVLIDEDDGVSGRDHRREVLRHEE